MAATTRVLILPEWQNSGSTYWQSRWQALHGFERVQQADRDRLRRPMKRAATYPPQLSTWRAFVCQRLPFPALVPYRTDDAFCTVNRTLAMAAHRGAHWGAEAVSLGNKGHPNGDSGLGDWPEGWRWLQRFAGAVR